MHRLYHTVKTRRGDISSLRVDMGNPGLILGQYRIGLGVELEHGRIDTHTNVTDDAPILTGKIALAHLNEIADYYTWLTEMEEEAEGK